MAHPFAEVRAIYFDLDDTLCGYWDATKLGLRRTFEDNPVAGRSVDQMLKHWAEEFKDFSATLGKTELYAQYCRSGEITRLELMKRVLARLGIQDDSLAQRLSDTYYVERHNALQLFPEAIPVLDELKSRYPLGLITNGPADIQRQEIETLQIGGYFDHFYIEGELGFGKPNPKVMEMAQAAMGVDANEILMVGNSFRHDIVPAQTAGWRTAWIRRPSDVSPSSHTGLPEDRPDDSTAPDIEINDLRELMPALG